MASIIKCFGELPHEVIGATVEVGCFGNENRLPEPPNGFRWDGYKDFSLNLANMNDIHAETEFLLEQSLAAAYFLKIFGKRCHESVAEYIDELNSYIQFNYLSKAHRAYHNDVMDQIVNSIEKLLTFNKGGRWEDLPIELIKQLFDASPIDKRKYPSLRINTISWVIPFLMWMNTNIQEGYDMWTLTEKPRLLTFRLSPCHWHKPERGLYVQVSSIFIGQSFSAARTEIDSRYPAISILGLLSHCGLADCSIEGLIGIIGEYVFHRDITRPGLSASHVLAFQFRCRVMHAFEYTTMGDRDGVRPDGNPTINISSLFNAMKDFVNFCYQKFGVLPKDKNIVARAFGCVAKTEQEKNVAAYLKEIGAQPSAEKLSDFNKVTASNEALQLISQNPTLLDAQEQTMVEDNPSNDEGDENEPSEDDDSEPEEDINPPEDESEDGDDTPDEDDLPEEEQEPPPDDNSDDDSSSSDDNGAPGGAGENKPVSDMSGKSKQADVSDNKGIEFIISNPDKEVTDTVMLREEIDTLISNILANPPASLSTSAMVTLKALKQYWLFTVDIKTVVGILGACIKIPLTSNKLKTQRS